VGVSARFAHDKRACQAIALIDSADVSMRVVEDLLEALATVRVPQRDAFSALNLAWGFVAEPQNFKTPHLHRAYTQKLAVCGMGLLANDTANAQTVQFLKKLVACKYAQVCMVANGLLSKLLLDMRHTVKRNDLARFALMQDVLQTATEATGLRKNMHMLEANAVATNLKTLLAAAESAPSKFQEIAVSIALALFESVGDVLCECLHAQGALPRVLDIVAAFAVAATPGQARKVICLVAGDDGYVAQSLFYSQTFRRFVQTKYGTYCAPQA
jgi:hypothetical protein